MAVPPPMMRHNNDLNTRRPDRGDQLPHVVIEADRVGRFLGRVVEFAAFAHEVVVGIDDQQGGAATS